VSLERNHNGTQWFGFDAYDEIRGPLNTPCWIYRKQPTQRGYAQMRMPDGSQPTAHRAFYMHHGGTIPEGFTLDHLCRNRRCVNPSHLEPVTRRENVLRGETLPAANVRKTHCPRGHEYTAANTRVTPQGTRACRTCSRERMRAIRAGEVYV
jgi:hypothetical protein